MKVERQVNVKDDGRDSFGDIIRKLIESNSVREVKDDRNVLVDDYISYNEFIKDIKDKLLKSFF